MNQLFKYISDLKQIINLKEEELENEKLKESKEQENLQKQEKQEKKISVEIRNARARKYILEHYKKFYLKEISPYIFVFLIGESIAILIFFGISKWYGMPPVNPLSIGMCIAYNLLVGRASLRGARRSIEMIREVKQNYKLEELIEKIKEKDKELTKIYVKKEEIKETLNQLNVQIPTLEKEVENLRIKRSQEISYYEGLAKKVMKTNKIEMYTKEIKELSNRRKNEMDVLINTELTLKKQK